MDQEWKVKVNEEPWADMVAIWLAKRDMGKVYNCTVGKDGYLELTEHKPGAEPPPPLMRIPFPVKDMIISALTEAIPPVEKREVDAELKATKYHLEDMRKLALKELT